MKKIAIFSSGTGSNARKLVEHFKEHPTIEIALIASNKPKTPVLDMAREHDIAWFIFNKKNFIIKNPLYVNWLSRK